MLKTFKIYRAHDDRSDYGISTSFNGHHYFHSGLVADELIGEVARFATGEFLSFKTEPMQDMRHDLTITRLGERSMMFCIEHGNEFTGELQLGEMLWTLFHWTKGMQLPFHGFITYEDYVRRFACRRSKRISGLLAAC